jgi:endonuclease-3
MKRKERFDYIIDYFSKTMPAPQTELQYGTPYELVVAVILSAQCTDKRVNMITPAFFERFPDAFSLASGSLDEVYELIRSCSYPNNKAKNILAMGKMLVEKFGGEVPSDHDLLQQLPGVGRKTANVVVSVAFGQPAMAVDTHVFRVSARIGLSENAKTPLETEKQLLEYFPPEILHNAHHWLILHGRYVCTARKPHCEKCGITKACQYFERNQKIS